MNSDDVERTVKEAASFLKPADEHSVPEQIHQFREEFTKLLDEAKIDQLVVLIDDLDRCLPATAIDILERSAYSFSGRKQPLSSAPTKG